MGDVTRIFRRPSVRYWAFSGRSQRRLESSTEVVLHFNIYWALEIVLLALMILHEMITGTLRRTARAPLGALHRTEAMRRSSSTSRTIIVMAVVVQLLEAAVWLWRHSG